MAEYSSIADSTHFHTTADYPIGENVQVRTHRSRPQHVPLPARVGGPRRDDRRLDNRRPSSVVAQGHPGWRVRIGRAREVVRSLNHPWMEDVRRTRRERRTPSAAWRKHADDGAQGRMTDVQPWPTGRRRTAPPPTITVVVPTVDRVELLERTLRGLAAQDGVEFEAIVVHDGEPGIMALLEQWRDKLPHAARDADRASAARCRSATRAGAPRRAIHRVHRRRL